MSSGLGDISFAMKLRDLVRRFAQEEARKIHPPSMYGQVVSFDRVAFEAMVLFPGSSAPVKVRMGATQPQAAGQKVRITPLSGDLFLEDVIGPAYFLGVSSANATPEQLVQITPQPQQIPTGSGGTGSGGESGSGASWVSVPLFGPEEAVVAGNGLYYMVVPQELNGKSVKGMVASVTDKPDPGGGAIQVTLWRRQGSGAVNMFTDWPRIEEDSWNSLSSPVPVVINETFATLSTGDMIRFDVIHGGVGAEGLMVAVSFG